MVGADCFGCIRKFVGTKEILACCCCKLLTVLTADWAETIDAVVVTKLAAEEGRLTKELELATMLFWDNCIMSVREGRTVLTGVL